LFSVLVCVLVFQSKHKETHLTAVKRILRYLKHTPDLALGYPKGCNFDLIVYADADYVGFLVDRKSTLGMAHFLGPYLVSWATKKQHSVAMSTVEAKYVAAASCCAQLLWIKNNSRTFVLTQAVFQFIVITQVLSIFLKTLVNTKEQNILTFVIIF